MIQLSFLPFVWPHSNGFARNEGQNCKEINYGRHIGKAGNYPIDNCGTVSTDD